MKKASFTGRLFIFSRSTDHYLPACELSLIIESIAAS
jgi:hypothetical protein